MISPHGQYMEKVLGECGETRKNNYSVYIPARWWFGAECEQHPTLASAIVAPGFDFADFELANRGQLLAQFPEHSAIISRLT
jgi:predicted cupin superfamily sugar epimerase